MTLDWRVSPQGNGGVCYRVPEDIPKQGPVGLEMQLADNDHPLVRASRNKHAGALYNMVSPVCDEAKPAGEWNTARILVDGEHVEHWINSVKVVEYELGSEDFRYRAQALGRDATFGGDEAGRIALQGWEGTIWYRNIMIRPLNAQGAEKPSFARSVCGS